MIKKDEATRTVLLEAALEEFSGKPYGASSLNDILAACSISKGSFYYHFKNKRDIYEQVLRQAVKLKLDAADSVATSEDHRGLRGYIHAHLRAAIEFGDMYPKYRALANVYATDTTRPIEPGELVEGTWAAQGGLVNAIECSRQHQEISDRFDTGFVARYLMSSFNNFDEIFPQSRLRGGETIQRDIRMYTDILLNGLRD